MEKKLTIQQLHNLRSVQEDWNYSTSIYLDMYKKLAKRAYTAELTNLLNGDFSRDDVELKIPKLPPSSNQDQKYTPLFQLDEVIKLYDSALEGTSLL